jgi:hypothetical protein
MGKAGAPSSPGPLRNLLCSEATPPGTYLLLTTLVLAVSVLFEVLVSSASLLSATLAVFTFVPLVFAFA